MTRLLLPLPFLLAGCLIRASEPTPDRRVAIEQPASTPLLAPGSRVDVRLGDDVLLRDVTVDHSGSFERFRRPTTDDVMIERYVIVYLLVTPSDSARLANRRNLRVVARP
jgi:hypothetical protein